MQKINSFYNFTFKYSSIRFRHESRTAAIFSHVGVRVHTYHARSWCACSQISRKVLVCAFTNITQGLGVRVHKYHARSWCARSQISRKVFIQPVYLPEHPWTKWSGMPSAIFEHMELCTHELPSVHKDNLDLYFANYCWIGYSGALWANRHWFYVKIWNRLKNLPIYCSLKSNVLVITSCL